MAARALANVARTLTAADISDIIAGGQDYLKLKYMCDVCSGSVKVVSGTHWQLNCG